LRELSVGDLVCLTAEDWSDEWRDQIAIVLEFYDTRRVKSYHTGKTTTVQRWKALVGDMGVVTILKEDVTLIQLATTGGSSELSQSSNTLQVEHRTRGH
jgi:hypothetical protein